MATKSTPQSRAAAAKANDKKASASKKAGIEEPDRSAEQRYAGVVAKGNPQFDFGRAREINPAQLGEFKNADTANAETADVGEANQIQASQIDRTGDNEYRSRQTQLADQLARTGRGEGPSIAALQLQNASDRLLAGQRSAIAAQRGVNPALALRMAGNAAGNQGLQIANQSAQARLGEAQAAQQQLASVLQQGRAAEAQLAINQAQLEQAAAQGNQQAVNALLAKQAELRNTVNLANAAAQNAGNQFNAGQQNQRTLANAQFAQDAAKANQEQFNARNIAAGNAAAGVTQSGIGASGQVRAAGASAAGAVNSAGIYANASILNNSINNLTNMNQAGVTNNLAAQNSSINAANNYNNSIGGIVGGAIQGGAGIGAAAVSDKRAKKNIGAADSLVEQMLDKVEPSQFEYKDKADGQGKRIGVMAQDLEKSPAGAAMVEVQPDGKKQVNFGKGLGMMLAAQAQIHQRLKALEGRA